MNGNELVSVPIWGLFNLTLSTPEIEKEKEQKAVSVPIWGLFNLTTVTIPVFSSTSQV